MKKNLYLNTEAEKTACFLLSDLFILPSIFSKNGPEVWGMVLNEAMSVGKPVVATNMVGAAVDLIENGVNGFIVKSENVYDLYYVMKKILSSSCLMEDMGLCSKKKIMDNFTINDATNGFKDAINYTKYKINYN
ncbi:MAG: glycosyltransferase [Candidatus Odinarchaeia archaeon]